MTPSTFFKELGLATVLIVLMLTGVHRFSALSDIADFSMYGVLIFVCFSIVIYFFGLRAARSTNRQAFTSVSFGFILYKMILSVAFVFLYVRFKQPTDSLFLIPFFIIYFYFTIFETYFMMKLGKMRPKRPSQRP